MLFDTHVHLDMYPDSDIGPLLARARSAAVSKMITVGIDFLSSKRAVGLAQRFPGIYAAAGYHPTLAKHPIPDDVVGELRQLCQRRRFVVAIGETGLDYVDQPDTRQDQITSFQVLADLAQETQLPLIVHERGAQDDVLSVLAGIPDVTVVVHYFTGTAEQAERYLSIGAYLSVGKPVAREGFSHLRDAVRAIPLDRLLLETDSYPLPGRPTEPADLPAVARAVAGIKGISPYQAARATTENALKAFRVK